MKYWHCEHCGAFTRSDALNYRRAELEDGRYPWETVGVCPVCGSEDLAEAKKCERCGEPIEADKHLCPTCEQMLTAEVEEILGEFYSDRDEAIQSFADFLERRYY